MRGIALDGWILWDSAVFFFKAQKDIEGHQAVIFERNQMHCLIAKHALFLTGIGRIHTIPCSQGLNIIKKTCVK